MNTDFQISVDVSQFLTAMNSVQSGITNIQTDLSRLQQAERFTYFANDTKKFADELVNSNKILAEQRELLKSLENYEKLLKAAKDNQKYNEEIAKTRAAMYEVHKVGGDLLKQTLEQEKAQKEAQKSAQDAAKAAKERAKAQTEAEKLAQKAAKETEKAAKEAEKREKEAARTSLGRYNSLTNSVLGLATAYLSLSTFTDFTKSAILAANNYEQLNIAFTTILKSKAQADELQAKIIELAAKTPYELPQLQETTKKLLAYGFAASEIIPTLTGIGDIAAGVGLEKLPQITNSLGKMHAANRMMLGDVNSLTKAGINILDELEKTTGKSGIALRKYISQGNVTYQVAYDALMRIAKTDFGGLMEKQSQTVSGLFSTLKDNATQASKTIGEGINERLKEVIRYWTDFLSRTSQEDLKKWGDRIGAAAVAVSMLVANILQLLPSLTAMLVIVKLVTEWDKFNKVVTEWNKTVGEGGATGRIAFLENGFKKLWGTIAANPLGFAITLFATLLPVAQAVYEKLTALSEREKDLNENIKAVVGSTSIQIIESNKLFSIIKDGTSTKEQHAGAVKKLLELSKQHGTGIETEVQLLGDLTNAEKLLTDAIIETAVARQKAMVMQKTSDAMHENEIKIAELDRKRTKEGVKQVYNAETNETIEYDPLSVEMNRLREQNAEIAAKGVQTVQDMGNATKQVKEILGNAMREPFGELNTQIKITSKNVDAAQKALEIKKEEIAARIEGMSEAQQKVLMKELKPFEDEVKRLESQVVKHKAELSRDKDAAVGIGGKKRVDAEISDPKAEKVAKKAAKEAENDAKRLENESWQAKQQSLALEIQFENDVFEKKKLSAKKAYEEHLHSLEKFHKDKAISDEKFNTYSKNAKKEYDDALLNIEVEKLQKNEDLAIRREKAAAKLIADNRLKELKETEIAYNEAKIKANRELKDSQDELNTTLLHLEKSFNEKKAEINQTFDKKEIDASTKIDKERIELLKADFDAMESERVRQFEVSKPSKRQRENFEKLAAHEKQLFNLTMQKMELDGDLRHQQSLAQIGIEGAKERVDILAKQIASLESQIKSVALTPVTNKEGKKFDIWRDVFGLDPEDDKDAKRITAIKKAGDELSKLANQYLATQLKNANKELKLHDDAVKKAEDKVKKEKDLKDKGLANDLAFAEKALEKEKELQQKALAEKQKVQKQQLVLESIGQFSSLVSASANIFSSMSKLGPIGVKIAVATIAAMFGSFAMAKADAWDSITKYRDGEKVKKIESGLLQGRSHDDGGILLEAEGGEWIVNKKQSSKFDKEIRAINSDNETEFAKLAFQRFAKMDISTNRLTEIAPMPKLQTAKIVQMFDADNEKRITQHKLNELKTGELIELQKEANQLLKKILDEIPAESIDLGDFVQKKKGNRIETIKKFKKVA